VKRLHFIVGMFAAALFGPNNWFRSIAASTLSPHRMTWADHIEAESSKTGRRYEHFIQMRLCHGAYDHLKSSEEAADRRARCAKICGLCRHLHSLAVWPDPTYRQPTKVVLDALADEPFYSPRRRLVSANKKGPRCERGPVSFVPIE